MIPGCEQRKAKKISSNVSDDEEQGKGRTKNPASARPKKILHTIRPVYDETAAVQTVTIPQLLSFAQKVDRQSSPPVHTESGTYDTMIREIHFDGVKRFRARFEGNSSNTSDFVFCEVSSTSHIKEPTRRGAGRKGGG